MSAEEKGAVVAEENKEAALGEECLNMPPYCDHAECVDRYYALMRLRAVDHVPTNECPDSECPLCAIRDCPHQCLEHYWHDGCPMCVAQEQDEEHKEP